MFDFITKALTAKNALQNAPLEMPGIGNALQARNQYQQQRQGMFNSFIPQQIHDINDMKYKMRAGLATNLGMPMDTFISDEDFRMAGMQRPQPFDEGQNRMLNILDQLYRR